MNALIIEDCELHRAILRGNLRRCGVDIFLEKTTLKSALETLDALTFDVICLDLKLADATALETIATLPLIASYAGNAALIVISGYASLLTADVEAYCDAMISKPYNFPHFKEGFDQAMRRKTKPVFGVSLLLAGIAAHTVPE